MTPETRISSRESQPLICKVEETVKKTMGKSAKPREPALLLPTPGTVPSHRGVDGLVHQQLARLHDAPDSTLLRLSYERSSTPSNAKFANSPPRAAGCSDNHATSGTLLRGVLGLFPHRKCVLVPRWRRPWGWGGEGPSTTLTRAARPFLLLACPSHLQGF